MGNIKDFVKKESGGEITVVKAHTRRLNPEINAERKSSPIGVGGILIIISIGLFLLWVLYSLLSIIYESFIELGIFFPFNWLIPIGVGLVLSVWVLVIVEKLGGNISKKIFFATLFRKLVVLILLFLIVTMVIKLLWF